MTKPIVRVVFAVLISLGIIAAAAPNVQARLGDALRKASVNTASMSVNSQALERENVNGLDSFFQSDKGMDGGHECGSDPTSDY
ncbi:MAG: hypothetical protein HYZ21_01775 [Chloroflexi bacterium]|nr:hypothetical protein [Chloroflexota bacterium]